MAASDSAVLTWPTQLRILVQVTARTFFSSTAFQVGQKDARLTFAMGRARSCARSTSALRVGSRASDLAGTYNKAMHATCGDARA